MSNIKRFRQAGTRPADRRKHNHTESAQIRVAVVGRDERSRTAVERQVNRIQGFDLQRDPDARRSDADILLIAVDEAEPDLIRWLICDLLEEPPMPVLLMVEKPSSALAWTAWFGIGGIALTSASDQELMDSVQLVLRRYTVLPREIVDAMPSIGRTLPSRWMTPPDARAVLGDLTTRERDVLRLVGLGRNNGEIAAALWLSAHTVRSHIRNVQAKMGLRSRLDMIIFAHEAGVAAGPG